MSRKRRLIGRLGVALSVAFASGGGAGVAAAAWNSSRSAGHTVTTAVLATPANLALTGDVSLNWTATTSAWATGTRVYRSPASAGTYAQIAQLSPRTTTAYGDSPGAGAVYYTVRSYYTGNGANWVSAPSAVVSRATPTFVFKTSSAYTGSGTTCDASAVRERDMEQNVAPPGPEETLTRVSGTGSLNFCSDTFNAGVGAGQTVAGGTTTVNAYFDNTSGSTCQITATLTVNGTTTLGSGAKAIPANTNSSALISWSFATAAHTFAAGERLGLYLDWQPVKSCASTDIYYGAPTSASSVTVPTIA